MDLSPLAEDKTDPPDISGRGDSNTEEMESQPVWLWHTLKPLRWLTTPHKGATAAEERKVNPRAETFFGPDK